MGTNNKDDLIETLRESERRIFRVLGGGAMLVVTTLFGIMGWVASDGFNRIRKMEDANAIRESTIAVLQSHDDHQKSQIESLLRLTEESQRSAMEIMRQVTELRVITTSVRENTASMGNRLDSMSDYLQNSRQSKPILRNGSVGDGRYLPEQ